MIKESEAILAAFNSHPRVHTEQDTAWDMTSQSQQLLTYRAPTFSFLPPEGLSIGVERKMRCCHRQRVPESKRLASH
jgi:hypothetical protein